MAKRTNVYEFSGSQFIYDRDGEFACYVQKADSEDYKTHTFDIIDGYVIFDTINMSKEEWDDQTCRDNCLARYLDDVNQRFNFYLNF